MELLWCITGIVPSGQGWAETALARFLQFCESANTTSVTKNIFHKKYAHSYYSSHRRFFFLRIVRIAFYRFFAFSYIYTLKCVEITWYLLIMIVILYLFIFVVICEYLLYLLIFVDIYWYLLIFVDIYWYVLIFIDICW